MNSGHCPRTDELLDYAFGTLSADLASGIELHLEVCPTCAHSMNQLDTQSDELTQMLRKTGRDADHGFLAEPAYTRIVARLSGLTIDRSAPDDEFRAAAATGLPGVGDQLGQYELEQIVGQGGMGVVFRARHVRLDNIVAVKVLAGSRVHDPKMLQRFRREMQAAGRISHPHVVQALNADESDGIHYLVMEFVDGLDLSALQKLHRPLSVGNACELIRMACAGLEQIHRADMVHRDLKPGNLMLDRDGQVRILDLGLALLSPRLATSSSQLTSADQVMGTIDFIAPEQADDTHRVDSRADLYGLGATLFSLLAGCPPHGGRQHTLLKKLSLLATEPAPSIQQFRADVPDGLSAIIAGLLDRDPERRIQSAAELGALLAPYCDSAGLPELLPAVPSEERSGSLTEPAANGQASQTVELSRAAGRDAPSVPNHVADRRPATIARPGKSTRLQKIVWSFSIVLAVVVAAMVLRPKSVPDSDRIQPDSDMKPDTQPHAAVVNSTDNSAETAVQPPPEFLAADPAEILKSLMRRGTADSAAEFAGGDWEVYSSAVDPDLRAEVIHRSHETMPPELLVQQLLTENRPSVRAGLLLALSEYEQAVVDVATESLSAKESLSVGSANGPGSSTGLVETLLQWYVRDPDAEVHAAAEFLLRRWHQEDRLDALKPLLEQKLIPFEGGWYQPSHAATMVVIPGPRTGRVGSPSTEVGRNTTDELQKEDQRTITIPHTFAISSREVTRAEAWRVSENFWQRPSPSSPRTPCNGITWNQAAEFCNRLSDLEGIPAAEHCYFATESGQRTLWRQKPEALQLTGYRLPTDDEWELSCRAGSQTSRPFGEDTTWLQKYAVAAAGDELPHAVGCRKPNSFGLFDMLGNVSEWIHTETPQPTAEIGSRRLRGGSAWTEINSLRSAARFYYPSRESSPRMGFRVARTLIPKPFQIVDPTRPSSHIEVHVGPPACPADLAHFADSQFQILQHEQVIRFGTWPVQEIPERRFRLKNLSDQIVSMHSLPGISQLFEVVIPTPLQINPGASVEFKMRMPTVSGIGGRTADLRLVWVGDTQRDFPAIRLHGCLEGPWLEVFGIGLFGNPPGIADLGTVPQGSRMGLRPFLRNIGSVPVEAEVSEVTGPFRLVDALSGMLQPHQMDHSFRVVLEAAEAGDAEGQITLRTKQEPPVEFRFPIRARVAAKRPFSSVGVFRNGTWLIDDNRDAVPDEQFEFGRPGDRVLTGDWNGDGTCDVAVWRITPEDKVQIEFHLRGQNPQPLLERSEILLNHRRAIPVAANRNGDGRAEIGYVLPQASGDGLLWNFDTEHNQSYSDKFIFGRSDDTAVTGDWNGDGVDDPAVVRVGGIVAPGVKIWTFKWSDQTRPRELIYLSTLDLPIAGDWDGDGDDDPGGWRSVPSSNSSFWQFEIDGDTNSNSDLEGFGLDTDIPFVLRQSRNE